MIVEGGGVDDAKGWSVFSVDPGGTTGWSWAVVGRKEVAQAGVEDALLAARKHRGGYLGGDVRFLVGQEACKVSDDPVAEAALTELMWSTLLMCGETGDRASAGAVPRITDVVVEDFILRRRESSRNLLSPVRLTAMLIMLAKNEPLPVRLHLSSPSAKQVCSDERLRRWGLYTPGKPHGNDAVRHMILRLRVLSGG